MSFVVRPSLPLPGYEAEALLGHGSIGSVYRARRTGPGGAVVAVKWLPAMNDPEFAAVVTRQAEALNALGHPHILRILEVAESASGTAVVTAYVEGGSLADVIAQEGRLAWEGVVMLATGIADALDAAHGVGILHRDLKPSNILLRADGAPKVSDFGLTYWAAVGGAGPAVATGTAEYLDAAVRDGRVPDAPSDVYSLGVICYQALTGELPFRGGSPAAVLRSARRGRCPPVRDLCPDVAGDVAVVVERAMARPARDRPATAGELARSFRALAPSASPALSPRGSPLSSPVPVAAAPAGAAAPATVAAVQAPAAVLGTAAALVVLLVVLLGLVAPTVATVAARRFGSGPVRAGSPAVHRARPAGAARVGCPVGRPHAPPPGASVLAGDLRGDGCRVTVTWTAEVAEAGVDGAAIGDSGGVVRFRVGDPGDVLLLADWRCQGRALPALYRPRTGQLFLFSGWAGPGEELSAESVVRTGVMQGRPRVVPSRGHRCERVVVDLPVVGKHMRPRQSG